MTPGASEMRSFSSVTLGRVARQLVANGRIRIGADAVAADVVHAIGPAGRPDRLISAIRSSRVGGERVAYGIRIAHLVAMLSVLSERRRCNDSGDTRHD